MYRHNRPGLRSSLSQTLYIGMDEVVLCDGQVLGPLCFYTFTFSVLIPQDDS